MQQFGAWYSQFRSLQLARIAYKRAILQDGFLPRKSANMHAWNYREVNEFLGCVFVCVCLYISNVLNSTVSYTTSDEIHIISRNFHSIPRYTFFSLAAIYAGKCFVSK